MANELAYGELVTTGLNTITIIVPTAGLWTFKGQLSLPTLTAGGVPSSVVTTIKQNGGSALLTSTAGASGFQLPIQCALADSITIAFTSSLPSDALLNVMKCAIQYFVGV